MHVQGHVNCNVFRQFWKQNGHFLSLKIIHNFSFFQSKKGIATMCLGHFMILKKQNKTICKLLKQASNGY